jgi:hypothetical protein
MIEKYLIQALVRYLFCIKTNKRTSGKLAEIFVPPNIRRASTTKKKVVGANSPAEIIESKEAVGA